MTLAISSSTNAQRSGARYVQTGIRHGGQYQNQRPDGSGHADSGILKPVQKSLNACMPPFLRAVIFIAALISQAGCIKLRRLLLFPASNLAWKGSLARE